VNSVMNVCIASRADNFTGMLHPVVLRKMNQKYVSLRQIPLLVKSPWMQL
jgi:hypothetical protein